MSLDGKINLLVGGLQSKNEETRFKSFKEFKAFLNFEFKEQKQDDINNSLDFLMTKMADMISSPDVNDKKAACLIIGNLLDLESESKNARNLKFTEYLHVLISAKDHMVIDLAVTVCGKLIATSGIASTADFAEMEVRRAFEWLKDDKNISSDIRKYAAVCVLGEISLALPSYFYQMVVTFFERILNIFMDPNFEIRNKAATVLRSVLVLSSQRDNQLEDRPTYYMDCLKKVDECLSDEKKATREEVLHGSLLILNELLRCCNYNFETQLYTMKEHLKKLLDEDNLPEIEAGKKKMKRFNTEMFFPSSNKFEIVENIHVKSIIANQYSRICYLVLAQKTKKMNLISNQQILILPRLAGLDSMTFFTKHFEETLRLMMDLLKEEKRSCLISIGYLCLALKGNVSRHFTLLIATLKQQLNSKETYSKKQKVAYLEPSLVLLTVMLASAVCRERENYLQDFKDLVDLLFSTGLSQSLIFGLEELTIIIPELRTDIQDSLLHLLAQVLTGKPLRHPGAPSSSDTPRSSTPMPSGQVDSTDPAIITLALKTLASFNFEGFSLVQFLTCSSDVFLTHEDKIVRMEAAKTCTKLLTPSLNILADSCQPQSMAALLLTIEVLSKLLNTAVIDIDNEVRYCVLTHLDQRFDPHLAQPERLSMLFIGLYDGAPKIRECVLSIIGRLCFKNPAYVMPFLRKILIQILSELEYSGTAVNEEASARMVGCLVSTATHLVQPYIVPIINCLLPKLRGNMASGGLTIALMRAIGDVAQVAGQELMKWADEIIVILTQIMNHSVAINQREVAIATLTQLIENTGYVVEPYAKYPNLLEILLSYFRTDQPMIVKQKSAKLLGVLGALDPHKHRIQTGVLSLTNESGAVLSMSDTKNNTDANATDLNASEMLVNMSPTATLDDYYSATTISVLMRCLRDPALHSAHLPALLSVSYIFKCLATKAVPYLPQVLPTYLNACRTTNDATFREVIFQQLGVIVSIVKFNIRIYLDDIIQLIKDFWRMSSGNMQCTMLEMVDSIVVAIGCEFRSYLPLLIPFVLTALTTETKADYIVINKLLGTLRIFGKNIEDFAHFLLPPVLKFFDNTDVPTAPTRKLAIETIDHLIGQIDLTDFASRILHSLVRCLEGSPDLRAEAMSCLATLARQLGRKYVVFEPLIGPVLRRHNIFNQRYELLWKKIKEQSVLKTTDELIDNDFKKLSDVLRKPSISLDQSEFAAFNKPNPSFQSLQKVWASAKRVSRDDWMEWLQRLVLELFKQSPSPALKSVATLANDYNYIARELFNPAFVSCWQELTAAQQNDLATNLESALKIPGISEITLTILNLMEFMEHCDKGITTISPSLLCEAAIRTKAYAKALHIKEEEFHTGPTNPILESLISINNKLQQPEAAFGVLEYARKKHRTDLTVHERWYEKLHKWEKALKVYDRQQAKDPSDANFLLGRMRCLEALGEWTKLDEVTTNNWSLVSEDVKEKMARMSANAAWGLGLWADMEQYSKLIPAKTYDSYYYMSVINIHSDEYNTAQTLINEARNILINDMSTLAAESYNRAYSVMVNMQVLSELEEVIEFKQNADRRPILRQIWWKRITGCQNVLEDWQKLLRIRSLVVEPRDDLRAWLKFCSLCRKNNRISLAGRTINLLLGSDANKLEESQFEEVDPHVLFAHFKLNWNEGMSEKKQMESYNKLNKFVTRLSSKHPANLVPDDINILLAKCYLKLGEWQETLKTNGNSSNQVVTFYQEATKHNRNCYKAWHAFAYANYEAVAALKENLTKCEGEKNTDKFVEDKTIVLMTEYCVASVRAFTEAIALSPSSSLQDTLRLLTLCFQYAHWSAVHSALVHAFKTIHINNWIQVIPQIIARIDTPRPLVGQLLVELLKGVGERHPQALIYPLAVVLKSTQSGRWEAANSILNSLRKNFNQLVDQAMLVSEELIRVAILWHELWHEGLEEASRLYFGERNVKGMLDILEPLHKMLQDGPHTLKETSFIQLYGRDLSDANDCCKKYQTSRNVKDLTQAWDLYYHVFRRITKQLPQLTSLDMQYVSPKLLECKDMELVVPGTYDPSQPITTIHKFLPSLQVIASKQRPRKLSIFGSNGQEYQFLLKGHEDLRQDERVMQSFGLVNSLLLANPETVRHNLTIQRFSVIPLSTNSGLIGWVPNCDTLHSLIRDYRDRKKILLNIEHRIMLRMAPDYDHLMQMQKVEVFEHALESTNGDDLAKILWSKSPSCEVWFERRTNYTRSLAVMSMVGYVLGLGDRHPSNLMLDRVSGKIMHIDFGDCFEVAMTREKFPEKIPFRLTRMLINAMEVTGIEGNYKITCERVMRVLRSHKDSVMAVLEAFIYDPLLNWRLIEATAKEGKLKNPSTPQPISDKFEVGYKSLRSTFDPPHSGDAPTEEVNKKALAIINRVRDKLTGRDFLTENNNKPIDIPNQVLHLVAQATSHENLCQCYIGWCPFW